MAPKAFFLLGFAAVTVSASAQFSIYGMATVDRMTGISSSPVLNTLSPASFRDDVNPIGFTAGVSYDFKQVGPALLSADLRGVFESNRRGAETFSNGPGTRIYSGLAGVQASFHTPIPLLQPYVEGAAGYARSNYGVLTSASVSGTTSPPLPAIALQGNLEYHAFAGLNLHFLPAFDFRAVEVGYGGLQSFGTYGHSYPIYSISSGVVFHIPPRR